MMSNIRLTKGFIGGGGPPVRKIVRPDLEQDFTRPFRPYRPFGDDVPVGPDDPFSVGLDQKGKWHILATGQACFDLAVFSEAAKAAKRPYDNRDAAVEAATALSRKVYPEL